MENQAELMPESARINLLYGLMLRLLGSNEKAYEVLLHTREVAPQKQSVLFEFAYAAEAAGKKDEALAVFKEAYELDTSYVQARELYEGAQKRLAE
jgi:predicted Zn-dependent protease